MSRTVEVDLLSGANIHIYECAKGHTFEDEPGLTTCPGRIGIGSRLRACGARLTSHPPRIFAAPAAWAASLPPVLNQRLEFQVWGEHSDPHECGPLQVTMDRHGIELGWLGAEGPPRWRGDWTDLRLLLQAIEDDRIYEENRKRIERRRRRENDERRNAAWLKAKRDRQIAENIARIRLIRDDDGAPE